VVNKQKNNKPGAQNDFIAVPNCRAHPPHRFANIKSGFETEFLW